MNVKHKTDIDEWLDTIVPNPADARDAGHMRRIIAAKDRVGAAESELRAAVDAARAAGDTWAAIGVALGITRQAAFQRFGQNVTSFKRGQKIVAASSIVVGDQIFRTTKEHGDLMMVVKSVNRSTTPNGIEVIICRGDVFKLMGDGAGEDAKFLGDVTGRRGGRGEWKIPVDGQVTKAVPAEEADYSYKAELAGTGEASMMTPDDARTGIQAMLNQIPPTMEASHAVLNNLGSLGSVVEEDQGISIEKLQQVVSKWVATTIACIISLENRIERAAGRPGVPEDTLDAIITEFTGVDR
ncbi:hypothetical protein NJB1907f44_21600 [Mycobacterium marinum]|nr:hypothetical protein VIMS_03708 [Mycobacterium marinum]GJN97843.1 hypothetical protein NJB1907f34b_08080 [Mycobacterium marinum]GJO07957.1 hypothetical protein NJB1808e29_39680 [Mycobacterium marinum]GJO08410.1 hypothetical protein NJB1907E90_23100 [Mycobacterium marinum]GJO21793.1 hypothetical protein NJB1907E11_31280 [Mycobacterium marinum]